jgi:hypothetical protein
MTSKEDVLSLAFVFAVKKYMGYTYIDASFPFSFLCITI